MRISNNVDKAARKAAKMMFIDGIKEYRFSLISDAAASESKLWKLKQTAPFQYSLYWRGPEFMPEPLQIYRVAAKGAAK